MTGKNGKKISEESYTERDIFIYSRSNYRNNRTAYKITRYPFDIVLKSHILLPISRHAMFSVNSSDCMALRLAHFLITVVTENSFTQAQNGEFSDDFYCYCLERLMNTDIAGEICDDELTLIYMKQLIHMLRKCGVISSTAGRARVLKRDLSRESFYAGLFNCFWNDVDWGRIFPSNPGAAEKLHSKRKILLSVLKNHTRKIRLDRIVREFANEACLEEMNDLIMISFIDFYLLKWLSHFGLIRYFDGSLNSPVCIQVTRHGKALLSARS